MYKETFETSAAPHITVESCQGELVVQADEEQQVTVRVQGEAEDVTLKRDGETFTITSRAQCRITCPEESTITIQTIQGHCLVEGVEMPLAVETVQGNLRLRATGSVDVDRVHGNLTARQVMGDMKVQHADGSVRVRGVDGTLSLDHVAGNLVADSIKGGLEAKHVKGNARLNSPLTPGATYRLDVDGNLTVRLEADEDVTLVLEAKGEVRSRLSELVLDQDGERATGVLGSGEASLEAQARGNVTLLPADLDGWFAEGSALDLAADLDGLGEAIETRLSEVIAEVEMRLEEGLERIEDMGIRQRVERAAERALRQTETAAEKVRRKAEQEAERARIRAERAERRWQRASGQPQTSRPSRRQSQADDSLKEEQIKILRLVEEGKVTPEEATGLLAALQRN